MRDQKRGWDLLAQVLTRHLAQPWRMGLWFGEPRASQGAGEGFLSPVSLLGWWR